MNLKQLFGNNLRKIRNSKNLKQHELALMIGYEPNSVAQVESGYKAVSFNTLEKMVKALDVNYYELFDFEELQTENSLIKAIVKELEGTNKKFLQHILNTIIELKKFLRIK